MSLAIPGFILTGCAPGGLQCERLAFGVSPSVILGMILAGGGSS